MIRTNFFILLENISAISSALPFFLVLLLLFSIGWFITRLFNITYANGNTRKIGLVFLFLAIFQIFAIGVNVVPVLINWFSPSIIPSFNRSLILVTYIWSIFIFASPFNSKRWEHILLLVSILISGITLVFTLFSFSSYPQQMVNGSWQDWIWGLLTIGILILGIGFILIRKKSRWIYGLCYLIVAAVSETSHLFLISPVGDEPLLVFTSLTFTVPLLYTMIVPVPSQNKNRKIFQKTEPVYKDSNAENNSSITEFSYTPLWLDLLDARHLIDYQSGISKVIASILTADICLLLSCPDEENNLSIYTGYDLIRKRPIEGFSILENKIPTISEYLRTGRTFIDTEIQLIPDRAFLASTFSIQDTGQVLFSPVISGSKIWGGILLLSPFSNKKWSGSEINGLKELSKFLAPHLEKPPEFSFTQHVDANEVSIFDQKIRTLTKDNSDLKIEIEYLHQQAQGLHDLPLDNEESSLQKISINVLTKENEFLRNQLGELRNEQNIRSVDPQIETELRITLEELARLQNALAEANMQILSLQSIRQEKLSRNSEQDDLLLAITQDIKQPLSEILGYSELILGEGYDTLNILQRNYVDNINNSADRLRSCFNELNQLCILHGGNVETVLEVVNIYEMFDQAIASIRSQYQEKSLSIQLNLPEELPRIFTDKKTFHNIISILLRIAGDNSPMDGEVNLAVSFSVNEFSNEPLMIFDVAFTEKNNNYDISSEIHMQETGHHLDILQPLAESNGSKVWVEELMNSKRILHFQFPYIPSKNPSNLE